jgi:hypothetical protein
MSALVDAAKTFIEVLKSPKLLLAVFLTSLGLLLLPASIIHRLQLEQFVRYRGPVALVCLVSGAALLVEIIWWTVVRTIACRTTRLIRFQFQRP